jgi:ribokinase
MSLATVDIFGLGVATVDDIVYVERFPIPNEKQNILSSVRQGGGLTATALVAAARQGCRCCLAISLGNDDLSLFIQQSLSVEKITLSLTPAAPGEKPYHSLIITEKTSGARSILCDNSNTAPPRLSQADIDLATRAKCVLTDFVFAKAVLPGIVAARQAGTPVVGDFEREDQSTLEVMRATNHLILPLAYALQASGESSPEAAVRALLNQPDRELVAVTDSERGAWYGEAAKPQVVKHQPAFPAAKVVDSTGCGDVFHGVYAASLVEQFPPAERIRRAAAAASLKVAHPGAQAGAPTRKELEAFLAQA